MGFDFLGLQGQALYSTTYDDSDTFRTAQGYCDCFWTTNNLSQAAHDHQLQALKGLRMLKVLVTGLTQLTAQSTHFSTNRSGLEILSIACIDDGTPAVMKREKIFGLSYAQS